MSGGGGGGGCFASSTPVWTPRGMIPISEIKKNDKVFTMNLKTGKIETGTVLEIFSTVRPGLVKVQTKENSIVCSENHRYCTEDNEFKEIGGISGKVRTSNGPVSVKVIKLNGKEARVHNFEVDGTGNYFVGKSKLLVHNRKLG